MEQNELLKLRERAVSEIRESVFENKKSSSDTPVYARINRVKYRDRKFYLSGDLFTDSLIEFDHQFFNDNYSIKNVRPVFFGFETNISIESVWHKANPVTRLMYKALSKSGNISFDDYSKLGKSLSRIEKEDQLEEFLSDHEYNFFNSIFSIGFDLQYSYNSTIYFSASPFIIKTSKIVFKTANNSINLTQASLSRIKPLQQSDINNNLSQFVPYILREYNVGQGNFSELLDDKGNKIVYDAGMTYLDDHNNFAGARNELRTLDAGCFFISHFDLDHILGTIYLDDSQFTRDKLWIIPEPIAVNVSQNAQRLIWFLHINTSLHTINDSTNNNIFDFNQKIKIYKGTAHTNGKRKSSVYANGSGIMISAQGQAKRVLLTGDCLYSYWSYEVLNHHQTYDYLVVPHHGCKIRTNKTIQIQSNRDSEAVVPVGKEQKNYHHPNCKHIEKLYGNGFKKIYFTVDLRNPITLNTVDEYYDLSNEPTKSPKDYIDFHLG